MGRTPMTYEVMLEKGDDGKPVIRQTGAGNKFVYAMRHVTVFATSERAARTLQQRFRQDRASA